MSKKPSIRKKKKLGNTRYGIVLLSITLALTIVGVLAALLLHANTLIKQVRDNVELHVYIETNLNESSKNKLAQDFLNYPFVNKGAENIIQFKSVDETAQELIAKNYLPKDFDQILGYNPIRPCFILKIDPSYATEHKLSKIASQLEEITGVYEVDLSSERSKDLSTVVKNLNLISLILAIFTAIALITISFLISNTIKLALFSQRFLIRSMQLVGAEKRFIKRPFLLNTTIQGLLGGVLAAGVTASAIFYAYQQLDSLSLLLNNQDLASLLIGLVLLGGTISYFSTLFALNKYLKLSLDDLY